MSDKSLNEVGETQEIDYASKFCVDREEDLEIPHAELPPARKVICVLETIMMGYLVFLSGQVLVGNTLHILSRFNVMYVVPWEFFLHLILPFTK